MTTLSHQTIDQHLILGEDGKKRDCMEIQAPWLMLISWFLLYFMTDPAYALLGKCSPDIRYVMDCVLEFSTSALVLVLGICGTRLAISRWGWNKVMDWWKPHSWKTFFKLLGHLLLFVFLLEILTGILLDAWGVNVDELPQQNFYKPIPGGSPTVIFIVDLISCVVLAPIFEEFFFRRFLPRIFAPFPTILNETICSLIFAAIHGVPQGIPALFAVSMFLFQARRECGLRTSILLHASYNLVITLNLLNNSL